MWNGTAIWLPHTSFTKSLPKHLVHCSLESCCHYLKKHTDTTNIRSQLKTPPPKKKKQKNQQPKMCWYRTLWKSLRQKSHPLPLNIQKSHPEKGPGNEKRRLATKDPLKPPLSNKEKSAEQKLPFWVDEFNLFSGSQNQLGEPPKKRGLDLFWAGFF